MGYICPVCHSENPYSLHTCRVCGAVIRSGYLSRDRKAGKTLLRRYAANLRAKLRAVNRPALYLRAASRVLLLITLLMLSPAALSGNPTQTLSIAPVIEVYTGQADLTQQTLHTWTRRHLLQSILCFDDHADRVSGHISMIRENAHLPDESAAIERIHPPRLTGAWLDVKFGRICSAMSAQSDPAALLRKLLQMYR